MELLTLEDTVMRFLIGWLRTPRRRILAAVSLILFLLAAVCLYRGWLMPLEDGICLGGLEVGGLTPAKAHQKLDAALEETLLTQNLSVQLPEEVLTLTPEEAGFQIRTGKAIRAARYAEAHSEISLLPFLNAEETAILSKLEAYAAQYDTELTQPVWQLEGAAPDLSTAVFSPDASGQTLAITKGIPAMHLDCGAVLTEILRTAGEAVTLCQIGQYTAAPEVLPEELPVIVNAAVIAKELRREPVNDAPDLENYGLIHGSYGTRIDAKQVFELFRQAAYGETFRLPVQYLPPEILGQEAYFQDVLGSCETKHNTNANRNHNLQLQCDTLNGFVLQPGETFSMNEVLGERTLERGYLPAPAYSGNRLVNSPGGGVCQGSTTLYNCVLLADLEVVFRACHGAKVTYVPLGLDAAINYLTTDFQFRNNWSFPVQIKAWMEDGYMKMQILGTDEKDYYIEMETRSGDDDLAWYARSYKCKYDKQTHELISRDLEAYSTYYKDIE